MPLKLVDVECQECHRVVEDVFVEQDEDGSANVHVDIPPTCGDGQRLCGPFKVVVSVPRHSKHSSWEVK